MKKFIITLLVCFFSSIQTYAFDKKYYYGVWKMYETIEVEITPNLILISDVGIEGIPYSYTYNNKTNTFTLYNTISGCKEFALKFPNITTKNKNVLNVICLDERGRKTDVWKLKRKK